MYPRHAESRIREALTDTRVVAIAGPRQSGKTTLARKIAGETHSYLTLDDPAVLAAATSDPSGLIRRLDRAVIDEIQRAPNLTLAIKQAVDEDQRPGRFLITGSADILAMPKAAESLAGRIEIVTLLPLSRSEIAGRPTSTFIANAFDGNVVDASRDTAGLPELVLAGGYPEALARSSERRRRDWHRAYLRSVMERDAREISSAERLDRLPDLFGLLAARAGQLLNWSALGNDARLDGKTVERYVRLLEQLYLVRRVPAWSGNQTQRLVSTPKLHFVDSGLLTTTLNLATAQLALDRSPLGPTLESFVFSELAKAAAVAEDELMISHYRDKDQVEVDFVIENGNSLIVGVEVKASSTVQASDFRGLRRLKDRVGSRFAQGIVLYDGEHVLPFGEKLRCRADRDALELMQQPCPPLPPFDLDLLRGFMAIADSGGFSRAAERIEWNGPDGSPLYKSSAGSRRAFCDKCGSGLGAIEDKPVVSLFVGTFDKKSAELAPIYYISRGSAPKW